MKNKKYDLTAALMGGAALWFVGGDASAADAVAGAHGASVGTIEELIVTAARREQSLQDVPIAVSAYSGEKLERAEIHDIQHLAFTAPGVYFDQATKTIFIRGIGSAPGGEGSDNAVSIFQDGVYLSRNAALDSDFLDMQSVEILRGAQGTLYGRNATGGAVLLTSRRPTDDLEGYAKVGYGSYNWTSFSGAVGGPIASGVDGRVAFERNVRDGYVTNIFDGSKLANKNNMAGRAAVEFKPSDKADLLLTADYFQQNDSGEVEKYITQPPNLFAIGHPQPTQKFTVDLNYPSIDRSRNGGLAAIGTYDFGWATLKSTTAYRFVKSFLSFDNDRSELRLIEYNTPGRSESYQEDLQLSGKAGMVNWLGGVNVFREDTRAYQLFQADRERINFPGTDLNGVQITQNLYGRDRTQAYSAYFELSADLTSQFNVTAGGRYSQETRKALANGRLNSNVILPNNAVIDISSGLHTAEKTWDAFTPEFRASYKPYEAVLLYVSATRGFKSGGISSESTSTFEPEYAWNYEGGLKGEWFDHRLRTNLAVFQTDYTDFQVSSLVVTNGSPSFVTGNGGASRIKGAELEAQAAVSSDFNVGAYVSYLDAKYLNYPDKLAGNVPVNWGGNRIPLSPEWKAGASFEYGFTPFAGHDDWLAGRMTVGGDVTWQGDMQGDKSNNPIDILPSFTIVNARVSYALPNKPVELSFFVRNLFNAYYFDRLLDHFQLLGAGTFSVREGEPRMVQGQISVKF